MRLKDIEICKKCKKYQYRHGGYICLEIGEYFSPESFSAKQFEEVPFPPMCEYGLEHEISVQRNADVKVGLYGMPIVEY
jgi:hypothetical protein